MTHFVFLNISIHIKLNMSLYWYSILIHRLIHHSFYSCLLWTLTLSVRNVVSPICTMIQSLYPGVSASGLFTRTLLKRTLFTEVFMYSSLALRFTKSTHFQSYLCQHLIFPLFQLKLFHRSVNTMRLFCHILHSIWDSLNSRFF